MKPAATSVPFAGLFALATLSAPDGVPCPALVTPQALPRDDKAGRQPLGGSRVRTPAEKVPHDDVSLPVRAEEPDGEMELAAATGKVAYSVSPGETLRHVDDYTNADDFTDRATACRRDVPAIDTDRLRSKKAPGFTPLGPWTVLSESIADPGDLVLTGSPAVSAMHGGGLLRDGDDMKGCITGLGARRTRCSGETGS